MPAKLRCFVAMAFGQKDTSRPATLSGLIEFYDFCFESYRHASKETLLGFMKAWPDQERLATLGQPELASLYAESIALAAWREKDTA